MFDGLRRQKQWTEGENEEALCTLSLPDYFPHERSKQNQLV